MKEIKKIWVVGTSKDFLNSEHLRQMLSKAYSILPGEQSIMELIYMGRRKDIPVPLLSEFVHRIIFSEEQDAVTEESYTDVLEVLVLKYQPDLLLFPSNDMGRAMAAILSVRCNAGLTADCVNIEYDATHGFIFSRAAMASTVIAKIICIHSAFCICTVKNNAFPIENRKNERSLANVEWVFHKAKDRKYENDRIKNLLLLECEKTEGNGLDKAKIIFGIGRGIGNKEGMQLAQTVAAKFGAEIGGTRCIIENEWLRKERQIGQSGISVAPDLYIAFGISGASQHIVGMKNAKKIIAINSDKHAPIFDFSDYGIVGDAREVLLQLDQMLTK